MNRWTARLSALLLTAALLITGCAAQADEPAKAADDRLLVCASFYTMADFAGKIAGERARVVNLVPAGGEPHDWEPSAQDVALLEQADLLVFNGAGLEHWVAGVAETLRNNGLRLVETTADLPLLEGVAQSDQIHEVDPHAWLDPTCARRQLEAIHAALVAVDPAGKAVYDQNLGRWAAECDALDAEYQAAIDGLPGREIVVDHEAFGYLCHRYGLTQIAAQGLAPEGEPDPARMAEVIAHAGNGGVKVVFFEEMASPKVAEAIAREIGAETAVLSPIEGLTETQAAAGGDYFSLMRENLERLRYALSE